MRNLKCMIVDDEPLAIKLLENYVGRTGFLTLEGAFTDSVRALEALREKPIDIVFLDIQMPDLNGMELSRMLSGRTRIIFTTAFKEYAFDSYEVNALDFLLKPIRYNKFVAACEKAQQWFDMQEQAAVLQSSATMATAADKRESIFLRVDGALRHIHLNDILYISGMKDYVMFYLENERRPLVTHLTMRAVEDMLPPASFLRVHRSFIVALKKIRSIDRNNCIYIGEEIIHVTDAYRETFTQFVKNRMAEG
ncbi:MAG: LytTR family DNA-binding domain-containing protein [Prevotellaceae bacterium]|nr:LytTR family DNA-binding domain-containing protein [Prevotellaceae bacterium]